MLVAEQPIAVFPAPGSNCGHRAGCASTGRVSNPLGRFERFQVTSIPLSRTSPPDEGGPMDATGSGALPVPITRYLGRLRSRDPFRQRQAQRRRA